MIIMREIIRNPRISDNQISLNTKVPLKTVNRKRKLLESGNILNYCAYVNNWKDGTGTFNARAMYIISMKEGITRKQFLDTLNKDSVPITSKHVLSSFLGEAQGALALILVLESNQQEDLVDILNAEIIPQLKRRFGEDAVRGTSSTNISDILRILHNYLPWVNVSAGRIKKEWPDELIFVSD